MTHAEPLKRLGVASLGFLRQKWLVTALAGMGWKVVPGWSACEAIAIWGARPVAARGRVLAARRGLPLLHLEDAFLRSVRPGQMPPFGLYVDRGGPHFDAGAATDLETALNAGPAPTAETRDVLDLLRHYKLSKYNRWTADPPDLPHRFVLIADQVPGDAALCGAGREAFLRILAHARDAHPGCTIVVRTHPAAQQSHFRASDLGGDVQLRTVANNPWDILRRAEAVHVHSSQLGAEAILAGHRPIVHGAPWFAGWGLSEDQQALPRRRATLTPEQLFEAGWAGACHWFDPATGAPRSLLATVEDLAARAQSAARLGAGPVHVAGCSRWKRKRVKQMLATGGGSVRFTGLSEATVGWASRVPQDRAITRIEDGFIRSRGLGAKLVPPLSLALDRTGIHYDPATPSELEALIAQSSTLPAAALRRAARLRERIVAQGVSKYNLTPAALELPKGRPLILVPGQVADDASVLCGGVEGGDAAVLAAARAAHPEAAILFRPHPDVSAGLRQGLMHNTVDRGTFAGGDIVQLIDAVDAVWTNTSLAGFEALLRNRPVTCLGQPFYAGWGLTTDLSPTIPSRRTARPTLDQLIHAALIDYPLYFDPLRGQICNVETVLDRLSDEEVEDGGLRGRIWARVKPR